jgi:hypothetical protein
MNELEALIFFQRGLGIQGIWFANEAKLCPPKNNPS